MTFDEAMNLYGCDKPDLRFDLKHRDVTDLFATSSFETLPTLPNKKVLSRPSFIGSVGALTRKDLDELTDIVKPFGGKGAAI